MTGRRTAIGLLLLGALVACAFAAPSAMAINGTTAFRCIHTIPSGEEFSDEHCTSHQTGQAGFTEMVLTEKAETKIKVNNSTTGGSVANAKLKGTAAGIGWELEASGFTSCTNKVSVENKLNGAKQGEATGLFCGEFSGVSVKKPEKCEIAGSVIKLLENGTGKTVVKLNASEEQEMFVEFLPPEGKPFAEFTFAGASCSLKGEKVTVTGAATANFSTSLSQNDGATVNFTTSQTGKTLKAFGNKAEFEGTFTPRAENAEEPPITLTTTNP
jgi:hypothetical protein